MIYPTNAIASLHMRPRKIIKTRGHFRSGEVVLKLLWLALRNITADFGRAAKESKGPISRFATLYADRIEAPVA